MKTILLLSVLFCSNIFSQEVSKTVRKWQFGINISPDFSYRRQVLAHYYGFLELEQLNRPRFGYTTGVNVLYQWTKNFGIESGIHYSLKGYGSKRGAEYVFYQHNPNNPQFADYQRSYAYFQIPLKVTYKSNGEKIRFVGTIGFTSDLLVSSRVYAKYVYIDENVKIIDNTSLNGNPRFNLSPFLSSGIEFNCGEMFCIRAEPTFRYSILKIENSSDFKSITRLWSIGLNIGCYYRL